MSEPTRPYRHVWPGSPSTTTSETQSQIHAAETTPNLPSYAEGGSSNMSFGTNGYYSDVLLIDDSDSEVELPHDHGSRPHQGHSHSGQGHMNWVVRDWNKDFQTILSGISDDQILIEEGMFKRLSSLASDFVSAATTYGKIIISEKGIPAIDKTIKPITSLGGIAGGEKYIVHGILFKFAVDHRGLYGADDLAAKAASHEMKGLKAVYNAGIPGICVPLLVLIDYRGFRLTAMSLLPISGRDTLLFGTQDAGGVCSVRQNDPVLCELLQAVGRNLKLKPHKVMSGIDRDVSVNMSTDSESMEKETKMKMKMKEKEEKVHSMPLDLEGHKGTDGRYYALDFSRIMPPAPPRPGKPADWLTRLLRPEFLKGHTPLSPDAFSPFETRDPQERNLVIKAHDKLHGLVIPGFVDWVCKQDPLGPMDPENPTATLRESLPDALHRFGINLRCLGDVWRMCIARKNTLGVYWREWTYCIAEEMVARAMRQEWRARQRAICRVLSVPSEYPFRRDTARFLNLCVGHTQDRRNYWDGKLKDHVFDRFFTDSLGRNVDYGLDFDLPSSSSSSSSTSSHSYKILPPTNLLDALGPDKPIWRRLIGVLTRFCDLTGVEVAAGHPIFTAPNEIMSTRCPLDEIDIRPIPEQIRKMNVVDYAEGTALFIKGWRLGGTEMQRLSEAAAKHFNEALRDLEDPATLSNYGFLEQRRKNYRTAELYYQRAINAQPHHTRALYYKAMLCDRHAVQLNRVAREAAKEAESLYRRALESNPNHANCLKDYANFLYHHRRNDEARMLYQRALHVDSSHPRALIDYSAFVFDVDKDIRQALDLAERAVLLVDEAHKRAETQAEIETADMDMDGGSGNGSGSGFTDSDQNRNVFYYAPIRQRDFLDRTASVIRSLIQHLSEGKGDGFAMLRRAIRAWIMTRPRKPKDVMLVVRCVDKMKGKGKGTKKDTDDEHEHECEFELIDELMQIAIDNDTTPDSLMKHAVLCAERGHVDRGVQLMDKAKAMVENGNAKYAKRMEKAMRAFQYRFLDHH